MQITRILSKPNLPVRDQVKWKKIQAIQDFKLGTTVEIEVPEQWSQDAANILASKYLRKAGVPAINGYGTREENIPDWLQPSRPSIGSSLGAETSAHQVFHRMVGYWTYVGWKHGYFGGEIIGHDRDGKPNRISAEIVANAFYDEIYLCLANQIAAPNSPQWFNTGLWWAYGIAGPDSGQWAIKYPEGEPFLTGNSYEYPQAHACFIQPIADDLVNPGGIMDLWVREARVFKSGSGSGSNMSAIRGKGEPLSGGGKSSGLMSFLEIGDRAAGAIQSGGTTRRAAVMRILDLDHPEIEDFVAWKTTEGRKARAMHEGSQGEFPDTWEGEAIRTVSGQNSNNSGRVTNEFLYALDAEKAGDTKMWALKARTDGKVMKAIKPSKLWYDICFNTWASGDPGVQFDDIIQAWHTCSADGKINGSNPCCFTGDTKIVTKDGDICMSELRDMFNDGISLPEVISFSNGTIITKKIKRAWQSGIATKLILIETPMGNFRCTPEHRWLTHDWDYVQAQLLKAGDKIHLAHPEIEFCSITSTKEFILTEGAPVFDLEVEDTHCFAIRGTNKNALPMIVHNSEYMFLDNTACNLASINLGRFKQKDSFDYATFEHVCRLWTIVLDISVTMASFPSREIALGSYNYRTLGLGYANAGGLLMRYGLAYDSDKGRKLIAKITARMHSTAYNTSAELARELGAFPRYKANEDSVYDVIAKHNSYISAIPDGRSIIYKLDEGLRNAQVTLLAPTGTISFVMDCDTTGIEPEFALVKHKNLAGGGGMAITNPAVKEGLEALGYKPHFINLIMSYINARGTVEGCPDLLPEHLLVFDCATPPQGYSRCIDAMAHIKMVAAVQPFLSGAVSKTVNLPNSATVEDIDRIYREAHRLGLKAVAPYRDGSKEAQPLNAKKDGEAKPKDEASYKQGWSDREGDLLSGIERIYAPSTTIPSSNQKWTKSEISAARKMLPSRRKGWTYKLRVEDQTLYLRTGEYADGTLGEIFVTSSKDGSTARGYIEGWAKSISQGLQYGVPLAEYVESFTHTRFEPAGVVEGHERIKMCSSVFDLIMRILGLEYLGMEELANVAAPREPDFKAEETRAIISATATIQQTESSERLVPRYSTGNLCPDCGSELRRAGTCVQCKCGYNSGCG